MRQSNTAATSQATDCPPRRPIQARVLAAGAVVALAAVVAGCGGGGSKNSGGSGPQGGSATQPSGVAYAQCMRSHGVTNFPDSAISTTGNGTQINLPAGIRNNPNYQSASQSCQRYLPSGTNTGGGSSSASVQAEINFANCMRSHGVTNFPEPDASGHMVIQGGNGSGIDPNSPTFQSAMQVCQPILHNAGLGTPGSGS
jgi:hypothetical protein